MNVLYAILALVAVLAADAGTFYYLGRKHGLHELQGRLNDAVADAASKVTGAIDNAVDAATDALPKRK